MGVIYQLTFFLALAILAIVITIFVFAVSLLGRAMEAAARSEREKLTERKESNVKEMQAIRKEMEKAEASGQIPKGLARKLKKLEKRDKKFKKELGKIRRAPELLTVKGGVVRPGASLIGALIFSGAAWYLSNTQIFIGIIPVLIWIVGFAAVGYSIFRIYKTLRVIESVAITSEEAALLRETEALKRTFRELEEERKPELVLTFKGKEFPLHVKADSEVSLPLELRIHKGDFAENAKVYISASPGLDFPGEDTSTMASDFAYPNYIYMIWNVGEVIKGEVTHRTITIKSPPRVGSFNIVYWIFCKGFWTKPTQLEIVVE